MTHQGNQRPIVVCQGLVRRFPPDTVAVHEVTFEVRAGEWIAITGSSGSGKSTLLNILGLLDQPDEGQYILNGQNTATMSEDERRLSRSRDIGVVFQAFHLVKHLTVFENVELGLRYAGVVRNQRRSRALDALDRVSMNHRRSAMPDTLSGGEQQRTAIARATAADPPLLLCDEPTGNLDSQTTTAILDLFAQLNSSGQTVITVTHDAVVAERTQRVLSMTDGRLQLT
jgi:putative ABC transport system ATP-binding protein